MALHVMLLDHLYRPVYSNHYEGQSRFSRLLSLSYYNFISSELEDRDQIITIYFLMWTNVFRWPYHYFPRRYAPIDICLIYYERILLLSHERQPKTYIFLSTCCSCVCSFPRSTWIEKIFLCSFSSANSSATDRNISAVVLLRSHFIIM